jgi:clan AA aspartic protease (TIGR02281 family)
MKLFIFVLLFFSGLSGLLAQTVIYMQQDGGVYTVPCKVNGLRLRFIFDTGASSVVISLSEALFMYKNNYLSDRDIYGTSYARLADGNLAEGTSILLREIEIGGIVLRNIKAYVVHELDAPLLLGQSAINQLGRIQIDGNRLLIFNDEKGSDAVKMDYDGDYGYYDYTGIQEVVKCATIYDRPDRQNGYRIGQVCSGKVMVLKKVEAGFYKVKSGSSVGYLPAEMFVGNGQ